MALYAVKCMALAEKRRAKKAHSVLMACGILIP
jgi:hypothetical protein